MQKIKEVIMKKIRAFIRYLFMLIIPVGNVIVFASLDDYDGNAGAVYQYMAAHGYDKKYTLVWLAHDVKNIPDDGHCMKLLRWKLSFRNLFYESRARYIFYDDWIPIARYKKTTTCVFVTHGWPPLKQAKGLVSRGKFCTHAICTSSKTRELMSEHFDIELQKIVLCGLPRNDVLCKRVDEFSKISVIPYKNIILWLPTFRKTYSGRSDSDREYYLGLPLIRSKEELQHLNEILKELDACIVVKLHPSAEKVSFDSEFFSNIILLSSQDQKKLNFDLYGLFWQTSAMLSDYSSVTFDYMLADKPLGYIIEDIEDYKLGFVYKNIYDYMPGHLICNMVQLEEFIVEVTQGMDLFRDQRHTVSEWANEFQDFQNAERVVKKFVEF